MATSKADRMKENAMKQVDAHKEKDGLFAGMEPIQEPAAEPAKKRGRPRKAEQKPQSASGTTKATKPKKTTTKQTKDGTAKNTKPDKKLFTAYITAETEKIIRTYSGMVKQPIGDVIGAAIEEYVKKNPPTDEQRKAYKEKRKAEEIDI